LSDIARRTVDDVLPHRRARRLRAFRRDLEHALPGRIEAVLLFGSRARGDAKRGSDYDVAVLVRDLSDRSAVQRVLSDTAYPHVLAGLYLRPLPLPADYLASASELAEDIQRDGVEVP
jgi:predicted nucleotidyltransferase